MVQPIISPYYAQRWPFPHIRGPNYTRPVFLEHSRRGNFARQPIVQMPTLSGLGEDPQISLDAASSQVAIPTAEQACSPVKTTASYSACMKFNEAMIAAMKSDPAKASQYVALLGQAQSKCPDQSNFEKWAKCFYGYLEPPWYANPLCLGGAILAGAVVLGLATRVMRKQ
jgi:hypothetical protein